MSDKKKSASLERYVHAYPPPKYFALVQAMSKCDEISKSEVINIALRNYFDSMSPDERAQILRRASNHY